MSELSPNHPEPNFFRCPVQEEDSEAIIRIRGKKIPAKLQEKSIDGFTVLIETRYARKLRVGSHWILQSRGEVTEVWAQWMFNAPDGRVQLGLRRLRDLTPPPKQPWFPVLGSYRNHTNNPELVLAGTALTALLVLSLPGVGDQLGTSGRIQAGLQVIGEVIRDSVKHLW